MAAGPARASRRRAERSSRRGRLTGGPPSTGTHSGRAQQHPEHRGHTRQPGPQDRRRAYETSDASAGGDHQKLETPDTTAHRRGRENSHCPLAEVSPVSIKTTNRCATEPPVSLNKHRPGYAEPSWHVMPPLGPRATKFAQHNPSGDRSAKNSPGTAPPAALPRKNSPSKRKNAEIGGF